MKYIGFLSLIILFFSCNSVDNTNKNKENISIADNKAIDSCVILQKKDTIIGDYHISYKLIELLNDTIIKTGVLYTGKNVTYKYSNRTIIMDLAYQEKQILTKTISKYDFASTIPPKNIEEYQITSFYIEEVLKENITFSFNVCIPDTDICYSVLYIVSNTGEIDILEEETEWEE